MLLTMENKDVSSPKISGFETKFPADHLFTKQQIEALEWTLEEHLL